MNDKSDQSSQDFAALRRLLQVNLVANTSSFGLRQWFRKRVVGIRSWVPAGQK